MPDLKNPLLKIARAKEHLDSLDRELTDFYNTEPCQVTAEEFHEHGRYVLRFRMEPAPKRLSVLLGDAVYSLRSCLDQLVWQLALITTASPYGRTEFPIQEALVPDAEARFKSVTRDVPDAAADVIRSLQPYHRGVAYGDDPLWKVNKLCNVDKHRVIPVQSTFLEFKVPAMEDIDSYRPQQIGPGHIVLALPIAVKAQMERAPKPRAGVAFGSAEENIIVNPAQLADIYEHIRDEIIPKFESFFPGSRDS